MSTSAGAVWKNGVTTLGSGHLLWGYKTGRGMASDFYLYEKGGGAENVLAMLKGVTQEVLG